MTSEFDERTEDEGRSREEGARIADRDRALVHLDEREIKQRMIDAFDRFIRMGFAVHLIGIRIRGALDYTIALYPDGHERQIPSSDLQAVADEFRLDYTIEKVESGDGSWGITLYPRW